MASMTGTVLLTILVIQIAKLNTLIRLEMENVIWNIIQKSAISMEVIVALCWVRISGMASSMEVSSLKVVIPS